MDECTLWMIEFDKDVVVEDWCQDVKTTRVVKSPDGQYKTKYNKKRKGMVNIPTINGALDRQRKIKKKKAKKLAQKPLPDHGVASKTTLEKRLSIRKLDDLQTPPTMPGATYNGKAIQLRPHHRKKTRVLSVPAGWPCNPKRLTWDVTGLGSSGSVDTRETYAFLDSNDPNAIMESCREMFNSHPHTRDMMERYIYRSGAEFFTIRATLAYLHDHMTALTAMSVMKVHYRFSDKLIEFPDLPGGLLLEKANICWVRRLFNVLVHRATGLRRLVLVVDEEFWSIAPWQRGVSAVYDKVDLGQTFEYATSESKRKNFIQHLARLPGAVMQINGTDSKAKERFVRKLNHEISVAGQKRGYLAEELVRGCTCPQFGSRELDKCCLIKSPQRDKDRWGNDD